MPCALRPSLCALHPAFEQRTSLGFAAVGSHSWFYYTLKQKCPIADDITAVLECDCSLNSGVWVRIDCGRRDAASQTHRYATKDGEQRAPRQVSCLLSPCSVLVIAMLRIGASLAHFRDTLAPNGAAAPVNLTQKSRGLFTFFGTNVRTFVCVSGIKAHALVVPCSCVYLYLCMYVHVCGKTANDCI